MAGNGGDVRVVLWERYNKGLMVKKVQAASIKPLASRPIGR